VVRKAVATPKPDTELIETRLKRVAEIAEEMKRDSPENSKDFKPDYEIGSSSIYADLGRAAGGSLLMKAQLVSKIREILEERGLTQIKAAALLGSTTSRVQMRR
jgi:hypothetical protein